MPSIRLNARSREILLEHARKVVRAVIRHEVKADKLDAKMLALVNKAYEKEYPKADFPILAKYNLIDRTEKIKVVISGQVNEFEFAEEREIPHYSDCGWRRPPLAIDGAAADQWLDYRKTIEGKIRERLNDYRSIITSARTFEEVLAVWPEAHEAAPLLGTDKMLPVVVDESVIARIKEHSAIWAKLAKELEVAA